ncbi:heme/hemin ABC transporter substrate-binding protein [Halodurantibacterium flavum]|uniref:Hemin ABC transporter substrate-binding protein n=1 Tax=Halodurantibacterium flavum TaxID=1382802 RepID=A0ABW4S182_9RHOB
MTALPLSLRRLALGAALAALGPGAALAEGPQRVIAAGGSVAEIVHALGAGDRLIARDTTSSYPPEVLDLPDVGYIRALSPENLIAMAPDLILAEHDAGPPEAMEILHRTGIPIVMLPQALDPDGVADKISTVATALGMEPDGEVLSTQVLARIAEAHEAGAALPQSPRVMFILSMQGGRLLVAGGGSSAEAMIELAGGQNAVTGIEGYKPLTDEAAVAAAPDLILMMNRGSDEAAQEHGATLADIAAHPALALTPAGAGGRVVFMDGLFLLGFGPRTGDAALELNGYLRAVAEGTDLHGVDG